MENLVFWQDEYLAVQIKRDETTARAEEDRMIAFSNLQDSFSGAFAHKSLIDGLTLARLLLEAHQGGLTFRLLMS